MKLFTKKETKSILIIFFVLTFVVIYNLIISYRRGRDATRKDDISVVQQLVEDYYKRYKIYPLSTEDGKIIGCFEKGEILDLKTGYPSNAVPCMWGETKFQSGQTTPRDPDYKKGVSYFYITSTNGKGYKIYISLEGKDEAEYQVETLKENLHCGTRLCNYKRVVNE